MGKIVLLILFFSLNKALALNPENIFQNNLENIEVLGEKVHVAASNKDIPYSIEKIDVFLTDPENRVNKLFKIPEYFKNDVKFWFYIYTVFSSHHEILHDSDNLGLIYDVIEFGELKRSKSLNSYTRYALQLRLTKERVKNFKKDFLHLKKSEAITNSQIKIMSALKRAKINIPKNSKKRSKLFDELLENLRTQTGQKDSIQNGINSYATYDKTFDGWLRHFDLPKELMWISFLESSFNVKARSKVGATGVWQFMRRIGKYFMPLDSSIDGRVSPLMSTLGAFHLLHQNKKILKRWDLSIPAYNSGTKHIIKARRKLKENAPSLQKILESYDHPHLGFASKNFYSEFLALSHAQAYKEKFYDLTEVNSKHKTVDVYLSKCPVFKKDIIKNLKKSSPKISEFNAHLRSTKKKYPRGTIIFSDIELTSKKYLKLNLKELRRKYPRNYDSYLKKSHSCSTK